MKKGMLLLAVVLALLLAGCGAEEPKEAASAPPEPSVGQGLPPESSPEASAPPEAPAPEELLARQPIDDTHDAFLVDTGGKLGTLLVTVEMGERHELGGFSLSFAVWNPADMSRPMEKMEKEASNAFHWHEELDANFDGFGDFSYTYAMGNQPSYGYLWVWDEDREWFVEVPEYAQISSPRCDPETGIIDGWARSSGAGDGETTFHRWEDGELVCIRRIESCCGWGEGEMSTVSVEDRVNGELQRVYYEEFPWDSEEIEGKELWRQAQYPWRDLDYHGEN